MKVCACLLEGVSKHILTGDHIVSAFGDYPYALNRYVNETRRLYRTMNKALADNPSGYLVGDHLTIADIAIWPWTTAYSKQPRHDGIFMGYTD